MSALVETLQRTLVALDRLGVASALVGGLAVSVRTEPRFTRDVDLAVAVADDGEAERLVRALVDVGFGVDAVIEQDAVGRLATVRLYLSSPGAAVVDLLFASSGIEAEVVAAADTLEVLSDLVVPVARTGHLIALKLLARDDERRPQDGLDLRALIAVADAEQRTLAAGACRMIMDRGYGRGRDLVDSLAQATRSR